MTTPFTDVGNAVAQAILDGIEESLAVFEIDKPTIFGQFAGAAIPVADGCPGMIWTRVATQFPTDGSGTPYETASRFDSGVPAWGISIETGHLYCHRVIEADGGYIPMDEELGYATRDGQLRVALLHALTNLWREALVPPLRDVVMAQNIQPWAPIGPDGGYSGGLVVTNVIVGALALC